MIRSLIYLHSLNICHRDIKPHNFVLKNNRIFLCDFGAAKIISKIMKIKMHHMYFLDNTDLLNFCLVNKNMIKVLIYGQLVV